MRPLFVILVVVLFAGLVIPQAQAQNKPDSKTLVYADFEKIENNRPVSARGGLIQLFAYEESGVHKSEFKGLAGANPPAPELVRIKSDDPNHLMKFEYALRAPNQWAGVTVEIHGKPDVDGHFDPDDVTGYKFLSLQVYATGIEYLRLEAISKGTGKDLGTVFPQYVFHVRPGLNTYRIPLTGFTPPAWARETAPDPKRILKALTSINLIAFCDQCDQNKDGMIVVDNVLFEK